MKKPLLIFILLLCGFTFLSAQSDTLFLRDGSRISVKIIEVGEIQIKYKRAENITGPTYLIPRNELILIVYANGRKETFSVSDNGNAKPGSSLPTSSGRLHRAESLLINEAKRLNYGGPRIGATYFGEGMAREKITGMGKQPVISQFGWQFEFDIFRSKSGMIGLVQVLPLIGGMEQGMLMLSGSVSFAFRTKNGLEFSMGPMVSEYGFGALVAVTNSIRFEDVVFPVTLSFSPSVHKSVTERTFSGKTVVTESDTGFRINLSIGFNTLRD